MIGEALSGRQTALNRRAGPDSLEAGAVDPEACQARLLEEWRRSATPLEVHLISGPRIQGTLLAFDRFMIAVLSQGKLQAIYKHAILVLVPVAAASSGERAIKRPILHLKHPAHSEPR